LELLPSERLNLSPGRTLGQPGTGGNRSAEFMHGAAFLTKISRQ